jgi:hypothetical protein
MLAPLSEALAGPPCKDTDRRCLAAACERKDFTACNRLGNILKLGLGVAPATAPARAVVEKSMPRAHPARLPNQGRGRTTEDQSQHTGKLHVRLHGRLQYIRVWMSLGQHSQSTVGIIFPIGRKSKPLPRRGREL